MLQELKIIENTLYIYLKEDYKFLEIFKIIRANRTIVKMMRCNKETEQYNF